MDKRYKFLLSNTGLFFISTFSSKFLVFLLMPLYTRVLSQEEFNTVDLVTQAANLLLPMVSLGIANSIIRFGLDRKYSKRGVFTISALVYAGGFVVFGLCYPVISKVTYVAEYIFYLYLYVICSCLRTLVQQFARARTYTRLYAVDGIMATVNTLRLMYIFLTKLHMGPRGYILATIGADFISFLFLSLISGCWHSFDLSAAKPALAGEMLRYCLPLIPTGIFWWITNVSDRFLVTSIVGGAIGGLYGISYKIPSIVNLFSTVFTEAWQISAVKEGQHEHPEIFFKSVFRAYQGIVFMAAAGLILLCRIIVSIMTAAHFYESWRFIPVLIIATVFSCFSAFLSSIYMVQKNGKSNLLTMMAGAISNIALNLVMIPKWGAQGAAIATLISYGLVFVLRVIGTKKFINIDISVSFMALNTGLTLALAACMVNEIKYWIPVCTFITAVIVALNIMPLYRFAISLLHSLTGKKKHI